MESKSVGRKGGWKKIVARNETKFGFLFSKLSTTETIAETLWQILITNKPATHGIYSMFTTHRRDAINNLPPINCVPSTLLNCVQSTIHHDQSTAGTKNIPHWLGGPLEPINVSSRQLFFTWPNLCLVGVILYLGDRTRVSSGELVLGCEICCWVGRTWLGSGYFFMGWGDKSLVDPTWVRSTRPKSVRANPKLSL